MWQLSRGCRWLQYLYLSWCVQLSDVSFAQVLTGFTSTEVLALLVQKYLPLLVCPALGCQLRTGIFVLVKQVLLY